MLGHAWRRLWATPIFTVFAVLSLALAVGVTTSIYSVLVSLTRNGLVVANGDRIGLIVGTDPIDGRRLTWRSVLSRADFEDLQREGSGLGPLAASAAFFQSVVGGSVSEVVSGEAVTGNYFSALGLTPDRGRLIQPIDDTAPARIVVVGHQFWRTRLAARPDVIGTTLHIGGEPFEVVGVAPEQFGGLANRIQANTSVWVPLGSTSMFPSNAAPPTDSTDRRRRQLTVFVVPEPSASLDALSAQISAIGSRLDTAYPIDMRRAGASAPVVQPRAWALRSVAAVTREIDSQFSRGETIIMVIVGLVLVVACTNLANLVLARGSSRVHELAVRRALGASRLRLVAQQLSESVWLTLMGATGAFIVTRLLLAWFTAASLPVSEAVVVQLEPHLDLPTLTLAGVSLLASLIVFGVAPAIQLTRAQLRPTLSMEGGSTGQTQWRTRRTLIAVQVMISLSFFLLAAFAVRTVDAEHTRPSGVDVDRLAIGTLNFHLPPWDEPRAQEAIDRLMLLVPSEPLLTSAAVLSGMPFGTNYTPAVNITRVDQPFLPGKTSYPFAALVAATPTVFSTLGVSINRGRGFDARDLPGGEAVAVLSEVAARQIFGTTDVVGRNFMMRNSRVSEPAPPTTLTVVGVASDTDTQRRGSRDAGLVYVPLTQHYEPFLAFVGRTTGDPAEVVDEMRSLAQRADANLVLDRPGTAALAVTGVYVLMDVASRLAGGLALLALLLGMAGLFGVLSHIVSRRTRELGLRIALGADRSQIQRLVLRDGLQPVVSGLIMGFLLAIPVRMLLRFSSPFSLEDALIFLLAPIPIIVSALLACYWPARRASRVDPNVALRDL